jgi:hypothetical protein
MPDINLSSVRPVCHYSSKGIASREHRFVGVSAASYPVICCNEKQAMHPTSRIQLIVLSLRMFVKSSEFTVVMDRSRI